MTRRSARLLIGLGLESSKSSLAFERLSTGGLGPPVYLASSAIDVSGEEREQGELPHLGMVKE